MVLKHRADLRTLAFIGAWFGLFAVSWRLPFGWWTPLCVVTLCVLTFFVAVITHNTIHVPMFTSRWMNLVTQVVLTVGYGHPVSAYVPGHNLSHHRHMQTRKDVMRTSKLRFRWNLLNQLLFLPMVAWSILRADGHFARTMRVQRPRWFRQFVLEWGVILVANVTLLYVDWQRFLLFFLLPHLYGAWGIVGINFAQHDGCDANHAYNHSRTFTGPLVNWFTFNNGFHGIHHMHPNLHWSLAPAAHAVELAPFVHPNLQQPSMPVWIWRSFFWPGKRLHYDGTPLVLAADLPDEDWVSVAPDDSELAHLGAGA